MESLLGPLQYAILPVFAFPALGFLAGLRKQFSRAAAEGINAYVAGLALPCLFFLLLSTADLSQIDWPVLIAYQGSQGVMYLCGYLICRHVFRVPVVEALILGMCAAYPNHVYFILPIAEELYGAAAREPVATMAAVDTMTLLCVTMLLIELITGRGGVKATMRSMAGNRLLIAIIFGLAFNFTGLQLHQGVERFLSLAGASAAPASLFGLGVILSSANLKTIGGPTWSITLLKSVVHPAIAAALFATVITATPSWAGPAPLVFAAPCASTGFVLGLRYGVPVDSVAKAVILSTVVSIFVIALFA